MNLNVNENELLQQPQDTAEQIPEPVQEPLLQESADPAQPQQPPQQDKKPDPPQPKAEKQGRRRRPEPAQGPAPRRVGTFTLGIALIVSGIVMALLLFQPDFDLELLLWLPPSILIALGVEILARYCFSKNHSYKYDILSTFICFLLICGSIGAACVPKAIQYWGPQRYQAQQAYSDDIYDRCYQALKSNPEISAIHISTDMGYNGSDFVPDYTRLSINFLTPFTEVEPFTLAARQVLDAIVPLGLDLSSISIYSSDENGECRLDLSGSFQFDMDAQHLAKLAVIERYEREPEPQDEESGSSEVLAESSSEIVATPESTSVDTSEAQSSSMDTPV